MKLGAILMLAGLIGALVVGPMYIKGPTGAPIMTAKDWVPEALEQPTNLTGEVPAGVFKWTDADGVVHFSDVRPDVEGVTTMDVGHTMTLPSEAFTGPKTAAADDPAMPESLRVLLRHKSGSNNAGDNATDVPIPGTEGQAAMNGALAEIAERFPQFKAMSDEMARKMSAAPETP